MLSTVPMYHEMNTRISITIYGSTIVALKISSLIMQSIQYVELYIKAIVAWNHSYMELETPYDMINDLFLFLKHSQIVSDFHIYI